MPIHVSDQAKTLIRHEGMIYTTRSKDTRPEAKSGFIPKGTPIPYPEFNTNIESEDGASRRVRLYQVAAVLTTRQHFNMSKDQLKNFVKLNSKGGKHIEASHLCRIAFTVEEPLADGSKLTIERVVECKADFNVGNLILEVKPLNQARWGCKGKAHGCPHNPPCKLVSSMPGMPMV